MVDWYPDIPWYLEESNPNYYIRNGLTSLADLILQAYCIVFVVRLQRRLSKIKSGLELIKVRITFACVLIEIYLIIFLLIIWLQNYWWYATNANQWVIFLSINIMCTTVIPAICFSILVFDQIIKMHKKLK